MEKVRCFVVGDAKGNPGPGAFGVQIIDESGKILAEVGRGIGNASDSFATYYGVMVALQTIIELFGTSTSALSVELCLDNEIVKKQLHDESPLTDPGLVPMYIEIHNMKVVSFPNFTTTLVAKEQNTAARQLVMEVLDGNR